MEAFGKELAAIVCKGHADTFEKLFSHKRFGKLTQDRKVEEGLKIYESLPKVLQRDKSILVLWASLLAICDEVAYADSLKLYADTFPDGSSFTLMMIDYYFVKEDYPKAFASIDAIEKEVSHEPVLSALRSGIALTQVHYEEALSFAEQALSANPTLEDAHWSAIPA